MTDRIQPHGYLKQVLSSSEHILFQVHQTWLVLFGRIFLALVLLAVLIGAVTAALLTWPNAPIALPFGLGLSVFYGLAILILPVIWWRWVVWKNHIYVLTNWRIIQVTGVFNKQVIDSLLEKVNDVKTDQSLLGRIFGYGDIEILTASEAGINAFKNVARPMQLKIRMLEAKEALEHGGAG